jgi:chromatin segregation and condensation protein Rec8/ScpA/Scc1 (kleisin family)
MFWEILQLKTWDFIDCGQEEAYGEIIIEPAARLHEAIPGEGPKREA